MMFVRGIFFLLFFFPFFIFAACRREKPTFDPHSRTQGMSHFLAPSQQHVPSYYKIHVEAGTAFLIFHTRGDKVNMRGSEDGYQARRVIAN